MPVMRSMGVSQHIVAQAEPRQTIWVLGRIFSQGDLQIGIYLVVPTVDLALTKVVAGVYYSVAEVVRLLTSH